MKFFHARFGAWVLLWSLLAVPLAGTVLAQPALTNVTATVAPGLSGVANGSVAWGDYDNDGLIDFILIGGAAGANVNYQPVAQLWHNTGSGFVNVTDTVAPGLPGMAHGSVAWGDYDNDGFLDLLLAGEGVSQVWRNTGGTFTDVTGLVAPSLPGVRFASVTWADYDHDGLLDFTIAGEDASEVPIAQIWRNVDGGFENVTASVAPGLRGVYEGAMAWGDYDNDGRLDLLFTGGTLGPDTNYVPVSELWRNNGSGFTNVTATVAPGLPGVYHSSVAWGDFNNDGLLDFLLAGRTSGATPVSQLWRNTGSGFINVTAGVAPNLPGVESGSVSWADYDNDGLLDFLITASVSSGAQLWRNKGATFTNVTAGMAPGLPGVRLASAAWADYNNDGRLDLLITGSTNENYSGAISQLWRNKTAQTNPPTSVITDLQDSVSQTSVVLKGRINPRGRVAYAWFVWGNSTNYGQVTAAQPMGNENIFTDFNQVITGLSTGVTYYYRAVGSNAQGQFFLGFEQRFTLAAPGVATFTAWSIAQNSATFPAYVNPNNFPGYGWFEWGTTPAYGQRTPAQSVGRGFGTTFSQNIFSLAPSTTYYYRAVASNSLGVTYGVGLSLITLNPVACPGYISPTGRQHGNGGGSGVIYIMLNCDWNVINTNSWITITTPTNGTGAGSFSYTVAVSTEHEPRSGLITIGGYILEMSQEGGHAVIVSPPLSQTVLVGGTATFTVGAVGTPPYIYEWQYEHAPMVDGNGVSGTATSNLVMTGVQKFQAGKYRVVVDGFFGPSVTLSVSCGFALSASNASFSSLNATGSVALSTVATNCAWSVVTTNPWVVLLSSVTNTGHGTVVYALAANPTTTARTGSVLVADQEFTITQAGGATTNATLTLSEVLDTEGLLEWSTIGTPVWFGQSLVSHDGVDAAQSGSIGNNAAVTALTEFTGPGTLSFWWKVSSQTNKDFLKLFFNGVQQTRISGEVDWQFQSYTFPSGSYTSKWTYSKNATVAGGQDRGWLDQVQFLANPGCAVTLSHSNATHSWGSGTGQVSVASATGCAWSIVNLSSWITPIVEGGGSNGLVRYTLATNTTPYNRTGVVVIASQPFTVVQSGDPLACGYVLSPTSQAHNPASSTGVVAITSQAGCAWTVSNTNSWVTILSGSSGSGNGQVLYSVANNTASTAGRTGVVFIAGQPFTVSQSPGIIICAYSISPSNRVHGFGATTGTVSVITQPGCAWSVVNTNPWISISSVPDGVGNGSVTYTLAANSSNAVRSGYVQIGDKNLFVTQSGVGCTISISPGSRTHGSASASNSIAVTAQVGCAWSALETNSWISFLTNPNGSGNGAVTYQLTANTNLQARTGAIYIGGQPFLVTQAGMSSGTNAARLQFVGRSATNATLSVQGEAGRMYVTECSEDLIHWVPISTNAAPSTVTDATVGNKRFYRTAEFP